MGRISLAGGAEFGGEIASLDRRALESAGGLDISVSIIPAAAAPDNNHDRAGANGVEWFRKLGIAKARALPLIDRTSADDPEVVTALRQSKLIYLLGGFPGHLATALAGSRAWGAVQAALTDGAVISGSSAGAMVLCEYFYEPHHDGILPGLNLIPGACILPHHDTFGKTWGSRLKQLLPRATLIGIDEGTGMLSDDGGHAWQVHGPGSVVIYRYGQTEIFASNDTVLLGQPDSDGLK